LYLDRKALRRAGILSPSLGNAYLACRALLDTWEDGAVLAASTVMLPLHKRPPMWAIAGFLWQTDAILDTGDPALRPQRYREWLACVRSALATGSSVHPVCAALLDTMRTWGIERSDVDAVLDGLSSDLTVAEYPTYADLERYIQNLHVPVVRMGLRIMEPVAADAFDRAVAFATAAQLMDFVCDVPEDVGLGRTYFPLEELAAFGLTPADVASGAPGPALRALVRHQVARARNLWEYGRGLVDAVEPGCRAWLRRGVREMDTVLAEIERRDYDISLGPPRFGIRSWGVLAHAR
jgi:15-cis-phytoene synthase